MNKNESGIISTSLGRPQYSAETEGKLATAKEFRTAGNSAKAIEIYEGIIAEDTSNAVALVSLGMAFKEIDELEKAKNVFEGGLKVCPEYSEQFLERLSTVQEELGLPEWRETLDRYDDFFRQKGQLAMKEWVKKATE